MELTPPSLCGPHNATNQILSNVVLGNGHQKSSRPRLRVRASFHASCTWKLELLRFIISGNVGVVSNQKIPFMSVFKLSWVQPLVSVASDTSASQC